MEKGELECLCPIGEITKWDSCCGKQHPGSSKEVNSEVPFDTAIPLLATHQERGQEHGDV